MKKCVYLLTLDIDEPLTQSQMMDLASNVDQIIDINGDVELEYLGERPLEEDEND